MLWKAYSLKKKQTALSWNKVENEFYYDSMIRKVIFFYLEYKH